MTTQLIKTLLDNLPRYSEEEGYFYSVAREDLINTLQLENRIDITTAKTVIELIETLLDSLAVLNTDELKQGYWCFISFSAQLMATSLLTAWADKNSRFFEANFWNTQGISVDKKEKQRDILKSLESQRSSNLKEAKPIRHIYVAWAIIKLNNQLLFYQREDTKKRNEKTEGDYSLIGGKLNQHDIIDFAKCKNDYLKKLQSTNSHLKTFLPETLKREITEETGLIYPQDYDFQLWTSLTPYKKVSGTAPYHALTDYYIDTFLIHLSLQGYVKLQARLSTDERLVAISLDDITRYGKEINGKILYINALIEHFSNNQLFVQALQQLADSFTSNYLFAKEKHSITFDKPLLVGMLGKEKPIDLTLTTRQQQLLLALAVHNRGFEFDNLIADIKLHPFGWLEINNECLQKELHQLADVLFKTEFKIENQLDRFFRFSVEPALLYFDNDLFSFSLTKDKITIQRATIKTALGNIASYTKIFKISARLFNNIKTKDSVDNYKKSDLHQAVQKLGLKYLLREKNKDIKCCINEVERFD